LCPVSGKARRRAGCGGAGLMNAPGGLISLYAGPQETMKTYVIRLFVGTGGRGNPSA
jgi:hypothetical protein